MKLFRSLSYEGRFYVKWNTTENQGGSGSFFVIVLTLPRISTNDHTRDWTLNFKVSKRNIQFQAIYDTERTLLKCYKLLPHFWRGFPTTVHENSRKLWKPYLQTLEDKEFYFFERCIVSSRQPINSAYFKYRLLLRVIAICITKSSCSTRASYIDRTIRVLWKCISENYSN